MRLLLVEDKDSFRNLLVQALRPTGWDVLAVPDAPSALEALQRSGFDLLVTDLRLPGPSGLELLRRAKRLQPGLRVLLMSAFGEPRDIVEAIHWGADDFLPKPFDLDHFQHLLARLAALADAPPPDPREPWIAFSQPQRLLEAQLERAAESDVPVLIHGPRGCGRSRTARRLHTLRHPKAPLLRLEPGSMDETVLPERMLARMRGGSILVTDLDRLEDPLVRQLTALLDRPDLGIHWMGCAEHLHQVPAPLAQRFGVVTLSVHPLSDRQEDLIPLFRSLLAGTAQAQGRPVPGVHRHEERAILGRPWPGGILELARCIEEALRATEGMYLAPLPPPRVGEGTLSLPLPPPLALEERLAHVRRSAEAHFLREALQQTEGDLARAAVLLGITPRTLGQRLRDHHVNLDEQ